MLHDYSIGYDILQSRILQHLVERNEKFEKARLTSLLSTARRSLASFRSSRIYGRNQFTSSCTV